MKAPHHKTPKGFTMNRSFFAGMLFTACVLPAGAQTIVNVTAEPVQAKVGEPVKITVNFDKADAIGCNVRVFFGDGVKKDNKINQDKDVPKVLSHTYTKAGEYRAKAEGKSAFPLPKCSGDTQSAIIKVVAAAPAATGPSCPEGWALSAKSVSKKSGAYTCTAKAGTALPTAKLACPGELGYFENMAKGQIGCRP
jgi:hypothetical protein